ncbi:condensation domain-containing protein, partial [Ascidiimonas sp. W6]|uniref:condensation domain-containing protein n=1 Tax=Ascidiimonas meishanensis TaxID=3128903 RepID=UPI0030ED1D37
AEKISTTHNFFELGGDSIKAIQVVSRSKTAGIHFKVKDLFEHQTIARLSVNISSAVSIQSEQGTLRGALGLLPIQHEFFESKPLHPGHYNQSVLLELDGSVSTAALSQSLSLLVTQHDSLRIGYEVSSAKVIGTYTDQQVLLIEEQVSSLLDIETRSAYYQSALDISNGDVCRFVLFKGEGLASHLLLIIHHLSVDGVSWRILLEDLEDFLKKAQQGESITLPSKGSSYRQWQAGLMAYSKSPEVLSEYGYWESILSKHTIFPSDYSYTGESTLADVSEVPLVLDKQTTKALLQEIHHSYGTEINDILLSALSRTLSTYSTHAQVVISLEGHGREELYEDLDITRTVGWFTTVYPVLLVNKEELSSLIADTKDQLRGIPNKGVGYGILRYLSEGSPGEVLSQDFSAVVFNYLGDFDNSLEDSPEALLRFSAVSKGSDVSLSNKNPHKLSINAMIVSEELRFTWSYDSNCYSRATIEAMVSGYQSTLESIIRHCLAIACPIKTGSDYGLPLSINHACLESFKEFSSHRGTLTDISVLSPLQEGMLFHSLYEDNNAAYVSHFSCDFIGGLDSDIFLKSWEYITKHHSILRTGIYADYFDIPVQCVYKDVSLRIEEVDYRDVDQDALPGTLQAYISKATAAGFVLEAAPLFSFSLVHLPDNRTKLLMKNHHILWDGWSLSVLMSEFVSCYERLSDGLSLPVIGEDYYGTFIRDIKSKNSDVLTAFWKEYLLDVSHPVYLPFFKEASLRNKVFADSSSSLDLGSSLTQGLKAYASHHHLTLNTMIQGAWSYLLSRYTGDSTVVFGATVSGRDSEFENIENAVGLYINTIPVCSCISEEETIDNWLGELQQGHTTAREEYSYLSLNEIQRCTGIQGTLFDTLLVFENYPVDEALLSTSKNLSISNIDGHEYTNYVLTLGVGLFGESVSIKFDYNKELFEVSFIQMLQAHFKGVLESMISGVSQIKELDYITPAEAHQLLEGFHPSLDTLKAPGTVLDIFKTQVISTPNATAVTFGEAGLTYQELDARSDTVAYYLQSQGYAPGSKIVLYMERSLEMLISIIGLFKSGYVYVPVDVSHPIDRLDYIVKDSGSTAVLSSSSLVGSLGERALPTIVISDVLAHCISEETELSPVGASSMAYIIYTSGTTGKPKGVMVRHENLHSFTGGFNELFIRGGRQPIMASNSFDIFLFEFLNPLLSGGTAALLSDVVVREPDLLLEVLKSSDSFHAIPSLMRELVTTISTSGIAAQYSHIAELYVGGDRVSNALLRDMRTVFPKAKLHVFYGPTESTVVVSCMTYTSSDPIAESGNYIGRPIHENRIILLDGCNGLCPLGVTGELCVSGSQVSEGYLNRDVLTSEKFIANPYG